VTKKNPSKNLEKFYFDTLTFDAGMLRNLVQRFGADHVLLGTDYPYDMGMEDPLGFIGSARLGSMDEEKVTGRNAARLLKIDYNKLTRRRT
jgi:aminocarboxymuconate-semialdehyde decarboxylase